MKLLLTFLFAFATPMVRAAEFFVSPSGRDDQPGSDAKPFASLEKARDAVRGLRSNFPDEAVTVWLMAGVHPRKTTFELTSADIDTTYRAKEQPPFPRPPVRPNGCFRGLPPKAQPPFPRPPVRPNGCFRGLPPKANS
jgi:hypothetical protein